MIKIGTSGYSYNHWIEIFYPKDLPQTKWLSFYTKNFDSVELNVTFYHLPDKKVFENWYKNTPKDFTFAVKGSRFITHVKKLNDIEKPLKLFLSKTKFLKEKLGVTLWQFPANLHLATSDKRQGIKIERLKKFLKLLKTQTQNSDLRHAFEFRNKTWFCQEIYDLLKKYNCALVISDSLHFPYKEEITADFIYIRFHGGKALYSSEYKEEDLKNWALKIKKWGKQKKDVYCYFNNDAYGYATKNAKTLNKLTSS